MSTENSCPQCHAPLPPDAPAGLCPRCLIRSAAGLGAPPLEGAEVDFPDIGDRADVARRLPQFEIMHILGQGGMGVVYQARQTQLDRLVALKILPPVDALSPDFVERFRREARALARLHHPNIVSVFEFGEAGGLYYIVMEFVDGTNLRELFETRKLTPAEALAIVPKICDALEYAHEEGIVHRDIKPENILIDKKGRVKIADFGLAKLLRRESLDMSLTLSGTSVGTVRYMAPEQMDKPETVDHRADLYSLGVVIYEMLTGEVPIGRFELPSQKAQVDVRLDEIVLHALEREPARRYQHASEVRDDVERVTSTAKMPAAVPPLAVPAAPVPTPAVPITADPKLRAAGALLQKAGWVLAVAAFLSFYFIACNFDFYDKDKPTALLLAGVSTLSVAAGLSAVIAGGSLRRSLFPRAVIPVLCVLCLLPATLLMVRLHLMFLLVLPIAFAVIAAVRALMTLKEARASFASFDHESEAHWQTLQRPVATAGFVAAATMLLWGFGATCTGAGVPPRFDMLVWLPYAFALCGAVFLLGRAAVAGRPPGLLAETVLAGLGMGIAALPWRGLEHSIPNPWSLALPSAWESPEPALFSVTYLVLGLFFVFCSGRRMRALLTLAAGLAALGLAWHFAKHPPAPGSSSGYYHFAERTYYLSLILQSSFGAAVVTAFLTIVVGLVQLRSEAPAKHTDDAVVADASPDLSRREGFAAKLRARWQRWCALLVLALSLASVLVPSPLTGWTGTKAYCNAIPVPGGQPLSFAPRTSSEAAIIFPHGQFIAAACVLALVMVASGLALRKRMAGVVALLVASVVTIGMSAHFIAAYESAHMAGAGISWHDLQTIAVGSSQEYEHAGTRMFIEEHPGFVPPLTALWGDVQARVATYPPGSPEALALAKGSSSVQAYMTPQAGAKWTLFLGVCALLLGLASEVRDEGDTVDEAAPRISRLALLGAIWAPFTLLGWPSWQWCVRKYFDNPAVFGTFDPVYMTLGVITFILAVTAGLGSTLLGGIAVGQIKRSGGKLHGLPMAACALLAHPVAAVGAAAFGLTHLAQIAIWTKVHTGYATDQAGHLVNPQAPPPSSYPGMDFMVLDSLVAAGVCFLVGVLAWRKIAGPPHAIASDTEPSVPAPLSRPGAEESAGPLRAFLRAMLWLAVIVGAVVFCWFDKTTYLDKKHPVQSELRIGALQPWLLITDLLPDSAGRSNRGIRPDFATPSGLAGLCAIVAGVALVTTRRRGEQRRRASL
jgi:predicted Ser/Thr protein kinase